MDNTIAVDALNRSAFERPDVIEHFSGVDGLFPAEAKILNRLSPQIRGSRILDLGIGAGRTTKHLLLISSNYTGLDYVDDFVRKAQSNFPATDIRRGDARDLHDFEENDFDFVLFSYNGIDCVTHEDRLNIIAEVHRVLKDGGTFTFSSHNRDYRWFNKLPWRRNIEYDAKFLRFFLYCLFYLPRHFKMKSREVLTDEYALINDSDHAYALLFYYINIANQKKQLRRLGFSQIEAFDIDGDPVKHDVRSHWIYYLATKN